MDDTCPCGSGQPYDACCGRWHAGAPAPTAEALMRARYCAFVRRDTTFLIRTSHPLLRAKIDPRQLRASLALGWHGLTILATRGGGAGEREGMVHFQARFGAPGAEQVHDERSRFIRDAAGEWLYRDDRGSDKP